MIIAPLPFEKISATRWLVRGKVRYNILVNWYELQAYFKACDSAHKRLDTRYKLKQILSMLMEDTNYLYFQFATPLVKEFESLNAKFQQKDADPHELSNDLHLHHKSLENRLYHSNGNKKLVHEVDYGAKFNAECDRVIKESKNSDKVIKAVDEVKYRCMSVLEEALRQVNDRLPPARNTFKGLALLSPGTVLNQTTRAAFVDLPFLYLADDKLDDIEDQYRKIICVNWSMEDVFAGTDIPTDTEEFWRGVLQHKSFQDLAVYALTCLVTPISNATVERVFSLVTCIKTKPRNRMQLDMLDALVRIRTQLILSGKCCVDFQITPRMLENYNADTVYALGKEENEAMVEFL